MGAWWTPPLLVRHEAVEIAARVRLCPRTGALLEGALVLVALLTAGRAAADEEPRAARGADVSERSLEPPMVKPLDAASELSAPRLPTPFWLPELAHPRVDASVAWTLGSAVPRTSAGSASNVALVTAAAEGHVLLFRRFYVGGQLPVALGRPVDGARELAALGVAAAGASAVVGNAELHARIVFPMPSWLSFGATFGLTLPTATFDRNGPAQALARAAVSMAPTELVTFLPGRMAFRPALDLRIVRGPFVVQLRQGVDVVQDVATADATAQARLLAHAGVLASRNVELSLEAQQLYRFSSEGDALVDMRRSAVVLGPAVRVSAGRFDVGGMLASTVQGPLATEMVSALAVHASVVAHLP